MRESRAPTPALYGWLVLLLLVWSSNFIFSRFALRELPMPLVLCLRYVVSAVCMLPVIAVARRGAGWKDHAISRKDFPKLLAFGILGLVGNQALFIVAISMTSVAHAGVISTLTPVLVLLGFGAMGYERITARRMGGLAVAAAGVIALQFSRGSGGGATLRGDAVMLVSVTVFAAFNLGARPFVDRCGPVRMNAVAYAAAGILAAPFAWWMLRGGVHASWLAWSGVLYMSAGSSVAGYLIYSYALEHLSASRVSVVVYLQPVVVSLLAILLLGERPGAGFVPAIALVLAGVYVVEHPSRKRLP